MNADTARYRTTIQWTPYLACSIAEGFSGEDNTDDEKHDAGVVRPEREPAD